MTLRTDPKTLYGLVATGEAITWALLISGLIIRATGFAPDYLVTVVGGLHGFMFLSYAVMAALVGVNQRWHPGRVISAVVLAIVPFATIPFDGALNKRGLLEGAWRTQASENPKDQGWFDSLFRWFIARPVVLVLVLLVGLVAVFSFLLWLGPPDEWFSE